MPPKDKKQGPATQVSKLLNESEESCEYYFENGGSKELKPGRCRFPESNQLIDETKGLRKVRPYKYTFQSYAKARWQGRQLIEVMRREFHDLSEPYYREAIKDGRLTINNQKVSPDYVVRDGDLMQHTIHRHEPPVGQGMPEIVDVSKAHGGDGSAMEVDGFVVEGKGVPDQLIMVNKPSSLPVHPSGRYHHNSLTRILHATFPEMFPHKNGAITKVFPCNRLDRLTSGLLTMALNADRAREFEGYFSGRKVGKVYVCRVLGDFPEGTLTVDAPIMVYEHKLSLNCVSPNGKPATTVFEKLSFNGYTSVVKCRPLTGRTHQIRVHLRFLGYPIANDPLYAHRFWTEEASKMTFEPFPDNPNFRNEEPLAHRVAERMREAAGGNRLGGWNFEEIGEDLGAKEIETGMNGDGVGPSEEKVPEEADDPDHPWYCVDCRDTRPDPLPDQLGIWLHAIQYEFPSSKSGRKGEAGAIEEGSTWSVRSPLPVWAAPDFSDDRRILAVLDQLWREKFAVFAD